jgi:hypothetical protein
LQAKNADRDAKNQPAARPFQLKISVAGLLIDAMQSPSFKSGSAKDWECTQAH